MVQRNPGLSDSSSSDLWIGILSGHGSDIDGASGSLRNPIGDTRSPQHPRNPPTVHERFVHRIQQGFVLLSGLGLLSLFMMVVIR